MLEFFGAAFLTLLTIFCLVMWPLQTLAVISVVIIIAAKIGVKWATQEYDDAVNAAIGDIDQVDPDWEARLRMTPEGANRITISQEAAMNKAAKGFHIAESVINSFPPDERVKLIRNLSLGK